MDNSIINNEQLKLTIERSNLGINNQFAIIFNSLIEISKNYNINENLKKAMISSQMQYVCDTLNFDFEDFKYINFEKTNNEQDNYEIEIFKKLLDFSRKYNEIQQKIQKYKEKVLLIEAKIEELENKNIITLKDTNGTIYNKVKTYEEQEALIKSNKISGPIYMGVSPTTKVDEKQYIEELKKIEENKHNTQKQIDNLNGLLKFYKNKIDKKSFNYKM